MTQWAQSRFRDFNPWLVGFGTVLLAYAILGNYVALPGYIRFIERGGTSAAGNSFDLSVLIGAVKTIVWMYSFQLGVLLLACAYAARERLHTTHLAVLCLAWLGLWSWPSIAQPGSWFYIVFGCMIALAIATAVLAGVGARDSRGSRSLFLGAILFFSFATWEVCGLGTTGRMLHPAQSSGGVANRILVTQSSKLMIEFALAWGLLLASSIMRDTPGE